MAKQEMQNEDDVAADISRYEYSSAQELVDLFHSAEKVFTLLDVYDSSDRHLPPILSYLSDTKRAYSATHSWRDRSGASRHRHVPEGIALGTFYAICSSTAWTTWHRDAGGPCAILTVPKGASKVFGFARLRNDKKAMFTAEDDPHEKFMEAAHRADYDSMSTYAVLHVVVVPGGSSMWVLKSMLSCSISDSHL